MREDLLNWKEVAVTEEGEERMKRGLEGWATFQIDTKDLVISRVYGF